MKKKMLILSDIKRVEPDLATRTILCTNNSGEKFNIVVPKRKDFFEEYDKLKHKIYGKDIDMIYPDEIDELEDIVAERKVKLYEVVDSQGVRHNLRDLCAERNYNFKNARTQIQDRASYKKERFTLYVNGVLVEPRRDPDALRSVMFFKNVETGEEHCLGFWAKRFNTKKQAVIEAITAGERINKKLLVYTQNKMLKLGELV